MFVWITRLGVFDAANAGTTLALNRARFVRVRQTRGTKMSTKKKRRLMVGAVFPVTLAAMVFAALAGAATQVAPVNTTPPTVTGTAKVGQTLTAGDGTWSNTPTSYAYQWLRCNGGGNSCVNVANGTQKTYTLVGVDSGNTMRVRVTATNADGSASAQSDQTAAVEPATSSAAPKNTSAPTISGTPKVGQTLTADNGSWSGNPTTYTYAWQRCDADSPRALTSSERQARPTASGSTTSATGSASE